jgi:very-short-patch-repair endonuclease
MDGLIVVGGRAHRERIRGRHERGQLVRLRRGVYADTAADRRRIAAAILRLEGGAVASHRTAAGLWGIPVLGRDDGQVHVTRPRRVQGTARYPGLHVHHAGVPDRHRAEHGGVPLTTPARTVVDLARNGSFRAGVVAADAALRARRCDRGELATVVLDCPRWPGVARARRVVAFADPAAASPLESISRAAFAQHGLPRPQLQAEITPFDIADFLWLPYRVIGEADGLAKYTDAEVLRAEKLREERFAQMGYAVVRWTWEEVFRRPDAVAWRVLDVLRRRGHRS